MNKEVGQTERAEGEAERAIEYAGDIIGFCASLLAASGGGTTEPSEGNQGAGYTPSREGIALYEA